MNTKIISVIGPHAGEELDYIISRKKSDIEKFGFTFWFFKKNYLCNDKLILEYKPIIVNFLAPKVKGTAKDTKVAKIAQQYSLDNINWVDIPPDMSSVTGNIHKNSIALMISGLVYSKTGIFLSGYQNAKDSPIKLNQFSSTQVIKEVTSSISDNYREDLLTGQLYQQGFAFLR